LIRVRGRTRLDLLYDAHTNIRSRGAYFPLGVMSQPAFRGQIAGHIEFHLVIAGENGASRRIAEKCGFVLGGTVRGAFFNDGRNQDVLLYSLLRPHHVREVSLWLDSAVLAPVGDDHGDRRQDGSDDRHGHGCRRGPQPDQIPSQQDEHQASGHEGEVPPLTSAQPLALRPADPAGRDALVPSHRLHHPMGHGHRKMSVSAGSAVPGPVVRCGPRAAHRRSNEPNQTGRFDRRPWLVCVRGKRSTFDRAPT
jgi:hypothetical protein